MASSGQYNRQQAPFTAHPRVSSGPTMNQSTSPHDAGTIVPSQYPTATLDLQALRTSHRMHVPMSSQSGYAPAPIGAANGSLFPGPGHTYMTVSQQHATTSLGGTAIQKHSASHNTHGAYPHVPFSSSPFDSLSLPPAKMHQGQPTNIGNLEYSDVHLDWLSSLAEASQHTNPTILVSPANGSYSAFTPNTVPEEATTFFAASAAADTCVTGFHSDIRPVPIHVPHGASGSGSPFNSIGGHTSLTPIFSSTPSTFEFSPSPGLTQHSPAVQKLEEEQSLGLVGLFSHAPSGNLAPLQHYSKDVPHPPSGGNLLTIPLATQLTFTDQNRPSEFGIHNTILSFSSCQAPYATGRKEVRFPNQKKVNVVEDMCKWFPEQSDFGKLLKRICATEWYHNGELEPTFGNGPDELTFDLALGFEVGQSILLGFVGSEGNCLYCGHTSPKKDRIVAHVREHLGLRPFVCMSEGCTCKALPVRPSFSSREALTSHLRNPIRIVTCNFCHKSIRSNNFRRHLNARHRDQVQLPALQRAKPRCMSLPA